MTGHGNPQLAQALYHQATRGITTMLPSTDSAWVAQELTSRFGMPYWQLAMTATDANRFALRFARHLTKRPKILVFDWCYHGSVDETLAILDEKGQVQPKVGAVGPPIHPSHTTKVVQFNDVAALEAALAEGDVAAVLAEPAMTNIGIVLPAPGYLEKLRELTTKYGTLLIIDETHTISVGPGGATKAWNLSPDMFVIGKPIGGGMPVAAYGFSATVAAALESMVGKGNSIDVSGIGGTLTGNALAIAAVKATLSSTLRQEDFDRMIPLATAWSEGVRRAFQKHNLPWCVQQLGCRAEYWFCQPPRNGAEAHAAQDHELEEFLHLFCVNRGVLITPFHNMALMSPYHTISDVDAHTRVFGEALDALYGSNSKL
eukprot:c16133_g1_i1.p1 GENE.c16133_g1_i1~~c16133_g1_i1.p1  ORF type:complete len:426 (+),score=116.31 c16133_g1_i1:162-1280(+)